MVDITAHTAALLSGKTVLSIIKLALPNMPGPNTTEYDLGYERAKYDLRNLLSRDLGPTVNQHGIQMLFEKLSHGKG